MFNSLLVSGHFRCVQIFAGGTQRPVGLFQLVLVAPEPTVYNQGSCNSRLRATCNLQQARQIVLVSSSST